MCLCVQRWGGGEEGGDGGRHQSSVSYYAKVLRSRDRQSSLRVKVIRKPGIVKIGFITNREMAPMAN